MSEAKRWKHEIKKLNIGIARNFISFFMIELPKSETVGKLARAVNSFAVHPSVFDKDDMFRLAMNLVSEIERSMIAEEQIAESIAEIVQHDS